MELDEPDILDGMRSWTGAQRAFESVADPQSPLRSVTVGWYDTGVDEHEGAFCMVRSGSALEDLVGDVVEVRANKLRWLVYCVGGAAIPTDLALSRPAFLRFAALSDETVRAIVQGTTR